MGKIKKILENELVGGTQNTDVYPVTSVKAVYDENNERLDHILNRRGVVNISTNYNADHIAEVLTLEGAINKVPSPDRVLGFSGTFLSKDGWVTYQFNGMSVTEWSDVTKWNNLPRSQESINFLDTQIKLLNYNDFRLSTNGDRTVYIKIPETRAYTFNITTFTYIGGAISVSVINEQGEIIHVFYGNTVETLTLSRGTIKVVLNLNNNPTTTEAEIVFKLKDTKILDEASKYTDTQIQLLPQVKSAIIHEGYNNIKLESPITLDEDTTFELHVYPCTTLVSSGKINYSLSIGEQVTYADFSLTEPQIETVTLPRGTTISAFTIITNTEVTNVSCKVQLYMKKTFISDLNQSISDLNQSISDLPSMNALIENGVSYFEKIITHNSKIHFPHVGGNIKIKAPSNGISNFSLIVEGVTGEQSTQLGTVYYYPMNNWIDIDVGGVKYDEITFTIQSISGEGTISCQLSNVGIPEKLSEVEDKVNNLIASNIICSWKANKANNHCKLSQKIKAGDKITLEFLNMDYEGLKGDDLVLCSISLVGLSKVFYPDFRNRNLTWEFNVDTDSILTEVIITLNTSRADSFSADVVVWLNNQHVILKDFTNLSLKQNAYVDPSIFLANNIPIVTGNRLELFKFGMTKYLYDYYDLAVSGTNVKGRFKENGYYYDSLASDSAFKAKFRLIADDRTEAGSVETNIIPCNKGTSPSSQKNILCIGDSWTNINIWVQEFKRRLVEIEGSPAGDGLINLNFIGTREGVNVPCEGWSGQHIDFFVSKSSPFYINGRIDLQQYCTNNGYPSIDYVVVLSGCNKESSKEVIKEFINYFVEFNPNIKILFGSNVTRYNIYGWSVGGLGVGIRCSLRGQNGLTWNSMVQDICNEYDNVFYVEIPAQIDAINNFDTKEVPANNRNSSVMVKEGVDNVHPSKEAYYQVADAFYNAFHYYCLQ